MPMFFFVLAGVIPLSLRNGAFNTVCPLSASGEGATGPLPPGFAAYGYTTRCHNDQRMAYLFTTSF